MAGQNKKTNIAIIGCGYVADYYLSTLKQYPDLVVTGIFDKDKERSKLFSKAYGCTIYKSLEDLINDKQVEIVVNLTNPYTHYEISRLALMAGKHVYTEKPLATGLDDAKQLVALAKKKDLFISSAPCSILGESAQTLWKALQDRKIGKVRLVYAEMDDGPVDNILKARWKSTSGIKWPVKDELEVGCILEHAGYHISWLVAFFGPVESVTRHSATVIEDKKIDLARRAPDFSVAIIKFRSGVIARFTCSIIAPHEHGLKIIGDNGVLYVPDGWHYSSPVFLDKPVKKLKKSKGAYFQGSVLKYQIYSG